MPLGGIGLEPWSFLVWSCPDAVSRHEIPVSQMGNYQEHLKKINPLRELDSGSVRTQLFGNPFKLERSDNKVCVNT